MEEVSFTDDVRWGLGIGLKMALFYTFVGAVPVFWVTDPPDDLVLLVIGGYFGAGLISGLVLGVLRPWANRNRLAAMAVGTIVALPVWAIMYLVIMLVEPDHLDMTQAEYLGLVGFLAVLFGCFGGWYFGPGGPGRR